MIRNRQYYSTLDDTATSSGDFVSTNGTLTFAEGETTKAVTVDTLIDLQQEGTNTFFCQRTRLGWDS